ncbi:MAG: hypothetical protein DI589_13770 [Shinella sp.]|nr:MAG: hypothetical protein DI589_13770 [Shinella sp.]
MAKMEQQVRRALKLLSQSDAVDQADLGQEGIGDKTITELVKQGWVSLGSSPSGIALYSITDTGIEKAAEPVPEKRKARSGLAMLEPILKPAPPRLK